jgi:hypothetical protein
VVVVRNPWTRWRHRSMNRAPQHECTVPANLEVSHGYRAEKLEQTVLAILYLNSFDDKSGGKRAWKAFPWM